MSNILITHLQIFGIGLSFGLAGPCLVTCAPILMTYVAGRSKRWAESLVDVLTFLTGRLAAYLLLGYAAGMSAALLNRFSQPQITSVFRPLAGVVSIFLGLIVLVSRNLSSCECRRSQGRIYNFGGLLILGFAVGIAPCAPLLALLFEVALISKNAFDGASYALSFGMGTFLSGLIVVGALAGLADWLPKNLLKSRSANLVFKTACALLLVILGLRLIV